MRHTAMKGQFLIASFAAPEGRDAALARLTDAGIGPHQVTSYLPQAPKDDGDETSPIPLYILIGGLIGFVGMFALQIYATGIDYPINIGGRPALSWPAYVPIAFEVGVLAAMTTGFVAFLILNRLPAPYEPTEGSTIIRQATRDKEVVVVMLTDSAMRREAWRILEAAHPVALEEYRP